MNNKKTEKIKLIKRVTTISMIVFMLLSIIGMSGIQQLSFADTARGQEIVEDESIYNFNSSNGTINGFLKKNGNPKRIKIPQAINGVKVRSIGAKAFRKAKLNEVILPEGLEEIGRMAFQSSNIEKITIPSTVTNLGLQTFQSCKQLRVITFVNGCKVKSIPSAFALKCTALRNVVFSEGIESIGTNAFTETSLENIVLPNSIKKIYDKAFSSTYIHEVILPANMETLGNAEQSMGGVFFKTLRKVNEGENSDKKSIYEYTRIRDLSGIAKEESTAGIVNPQLVKLTFEDAKGNALKPSMDVTGQKNLQYSEEKGSLSKGNLVKGAGEYLTDYVQDINLQDFEDIKDVDSTGFIKLIKGNYYKNNGTYEFKAPDIEGYVKPQNVIKKITSDDHEVHFIYKKQSTDEEDLPALDDPAKEKAMKDLEGYKDPKQISNGEMKSKLDEILKEAHKQIAKTKDQNELDKIVRDTKHEIRKNVATDEETKLYEANKNIYFKYGPKDGNGEIVNMDVDGSFTLPMSANGGYFFVKGHESEIPNWVCSEEVGYYNTIDFIGYYGDFRAKKKIEDYPGTVTYSEGGKQITGHYKLNIVPAGIDEIKAFVDGKEVSVDKPVEVQGTEHVNVEIKGHQKATDTWVTLKHNEVKPKYDSQVIPGVKPLSFYLPNGGETVIEFALTEDPKVKTALKIVTKHIGIEDFNVKVPKTFEMDDWNVLGGYWVGVTSGNGPKQYMIQVTPENTSDTKFVWKSLTPDIADYMEKFSNGIIPKKPGHARFEVYPEAKPDLKKIVELDFVYKYPLKSATVKDGDTIYIKPNKEITLAIDLNPANASEPRFNWTYDKEDMATVKSYIATEEGNVNAGKWGVHKIQTFDEEGEVNVTGTPFDTTGGAKPIKFKLVISNKGKPAPVNKTKLNEAIKQADELIATVKGSADGTDVDPKDKWATEEEIETFQDEIDNAKSIAESDDPATTQKVVDDTLKQLQTAKASFEQNLKAGTKKPVINKKALKEAIDKAEAKKKDVVVSKTGDGSDVETTKKWVREATMKEFEAALKEAKAAYSDASTPQTYVDESTEMLEGLIKDFNPKDGTKKPAPADKTKLNEAIKQADELIATVKGSADGTDVDPKDKWATEEDIETFQDEIDNAKSISESDDPATTQKVVDDTLRQLQTAKASFEQNLKPGTKKEVTPTPNYADLTALNKAIENAKIAIKDVKTSKDGKDIAKANKWVTPEAMKAMTNKIAEAEALVKIKPTEDKKADVEKMTADLKKLTEGFKPAAGTKKEVTPNPNPDPNPSPDPKPNPEEKAKLADATDLNKDNNLTKDNGAYVYTIGVSKGLSFRITGTNPDQLISVSIDDKVLVKDKDYTVVKGSILLNLRRETLDKLSVGRHYLTVKTRDGDVKTSFVVKGNATDGNVNPNPNSNQNNKTGNKPDIRPGENGNGNGNGNAKQAVNNGGKATNTGDNSMAVGYGMLAVMLTGATYFVVRRRKNQ